MIKKILKKILEPIKNLKVITFLTDIFCYISACALIIPSAAAIERNILLDKKEKEVGQYLSTLSRTLGESAYLSNFGLTSSLIHEMNIVAGSYDGRIMVFDSGLECISDSYNVENDKTYISGYVIRALESNSQAETVNKDSDRTIELYYPVRYGNISQQADGVIFFAFSVSSEYENSERLGNTLALIAVLGLFFILVIAIFHARHISMPLKKITKSINQISDGYRNSSFQMKNFKEFEEMTLALDNMVTRLNSIENSRQEFVSNVSHELKTPLTSIKILSDSLLMQPDASPEVYREFLGDINSEIDRENRIINDLLELVKLDRNNGEMHIAVVSINEMIEILMKRMKPIAQTRNVELVFESYRKVDAEVDEVKLMLAISNLMENAVKYNKEAGSVKVTLDSDYKFFTVTVSDTGIGIPNECLGMIFDRFYRVDKMRARKTGGTGLGLSIAKSVVLMHDGHIRVESKEGEGTSFIMKIPLSFGNAG